MKQRDIARWLGFPGAQAWANIISKIPAAIVSLETVVALRNASANPEVEEFLCHSRTLNAGSVALILDPRKLRLLAIR